MAHADAVERTGASAEAAWSAVLAVDADHAGALFALGRARVLARDAEVGAALLRRAERSDPTAPDIPLFLGLAARLLGDDAGAVAAFDRALAIDPYFFLALMSKAHVQAQLGQRRAATVTYRAALQAAPDPAARPPSVTRQLAQAQAFLAAEAARFGAYLRAAVAPARARHASADFARFDACLEIFSGARPPPPSEARFAPRPSYLHVPGLPARPFHPRAAFGWLDDLEARTATIAAEYLALAQAEATSFAPYIQRAPHEPVEQWRALNGSSAWRTAFLWRDGAANAAVLERCPHTARALEAAPMCVQPGLAPTAMFSVLSPRTHIPPHTGATNARLIVHLPLIIPPGCTYRVGEVRTEWTRGRAFVFDDSIEHEARNDSDAARVVLIFDIWAPDLTPAERALICAMTAAAQRYA